MSVHAMKAAKSPQVASRTSGLLCPLCGAGTFVTDSRPLTNATRRRRQCTGCEARFTSYESFSALPSQAQLEAMLYRIDDVIEEAKAFRDTVAQMILANGDDVDG